MASQTPYAMLVGTWVFYLAAAIEAKDNLDVTPSGSWAALGATEGDQNYNYQGALTALMNNDYTGPLKHIRPSEGFTVVATLKDLTLEDWAKVTSMLTSDVNTTTSGALNVKQLPLRRGYIPNRYSLTARGGAVETNNTMSGYGAWPAQIYIPQGVFDGEPSLAFTKGGSPGLQFTFTAEIETGQAAGYEFGYIEMQSS